MTLKTIKGIDERKWFEFKSLAAQKGVSMGSLFEIMVEDYSKRGGDVWNKILLGEKILSEKEADDMLIEITELRKEKGFRV